MSKTFKNGDRVRWTGAFDAALAYPSAVGELGTVAGVRPPMTSRYPRGGDIVDVQWDAKDYNSRCGLGTGIFAANLELVTPEPQTFKAGDRVVVDSTNSLIERYNGQAGTVTEPRLSGGFIALDTERGRTRYFNFASLRPEEKTVNIKNEIKIAITNLFPKAGSTLNSLARELLVATSAASVADARKKKAKEAAVAGGLVLAEYRPGEVTSFDDAEFTVVAKTKEPTSKLDQTVLREALHKAGLSRAKIDAAFVAATTENKPATSYEVIQK